MFGKLRKKLKSWLGKDEKEEQAKTDVPEKPEEKKPTETEDIKEEKKVVETPKDDIKEPVLEEEPEKQEEKPEELPEIKKEKLFTDPEPLPEIVENIQEEIKEKPEKKGFFAKLKSKFKTTKLTQDHVNDIFDELELILLENNVALEVVDKIKENLSKVLVGTEIKKDEIQETIINSLKETILEVLIEPKDLIETIKSNSGTFTIVFFGINGSGKTTSISKLAHKLKKNGISCVFAAADTFRAASIEQLEIHAKKLDIPIIKQEYGADPTAVAFDAKKYAEKNKIKCVLVDTAGRMYTKENLIKQMEKLIRVIKPDLKIFVGESITGNDATEQAKTFNEAMDIDGIILSKADVDEKAGTILSVSQVTKKPIYFLGVGQNYDDLQEFKKDNVIKNLGLD